jgi:carboxyl-terminal processing protease
MKHLKNNQLIGCLVLSIVLVFSVCKAQPVNQNDTKANAQKFAYLLQLINYQYVDNVDQHKIVEDAIRKALQDLDPHSVYIPKEEVEKTNEPLVGNFDGIGVQFQIFKDTIIVVSPVVGGPSEKLGIMAGDKIVMIDGVGATGKNITNQYVFDHLRGPRGTAVNVSIKRRGVKELLEYRIIRDKIPINSIDAAYMLTKDIGYVKLSRFARSSADEFQDAVSNLKKSGATSLILDLRQNSGGYLDIAYDLADQFLPAGSLLVYTQGKHSARRDYKASGDGIWESGKLAVLIDEGSASASEIVTGAVQDWDRGVVIGRRSFGKGLVQQQYPMPDSSLIRLTTARYYTPSGRCIQKPYVPGEEEYFDEVSERYNKGELLHQDSIHFADSLKFFTKHNRVVFGGGGIMPDVFVPLDTTFSSKYYIDVFRKGLLNDYAMDFVDKNRSSLAKKYPTTQSFLDNFREDNKLLEDFAQYAEGKKLPRNEKDLATSGKQITNIIKALIGRNLFTINTYYQVIGTQDDDLKKAVEILGNDNQLSGILTQKQ